ncbi:MAG: hypothetical protein HY820_11240 [Acidobacteria bacterium]|nr:hypothetical protein [Acidobacteriota bacterium]
MTPEAGQVGPPTKHAVPPTVILPTLMVTPIEKRVFSAQDYGQPLTEFVDRFGAAYKAEVEEFVRRCVAGEPFAVTHRDGVPHGSDRRRDAVYCGEGERGKDWVGGLGFTRMTTPRVFEQIRVSNAG